MKKIYAILAASLVTGTAMAAVPKTSHHNVVEAFNPQKAAIVEQAHADLLNGVVGETYNLKMQKAGADVSYLVRSTKNVRRFIDLITGDLTFDQRPYYWYTISFQDKTESQTTVAVFDYIIPCVAVLKADMLENGDDYYDADDNFNWEKAVADFGYADKAAAQAAPSFKEICDAMNGYFMGEYPYGYLGPYSCWNYNPSTYQGTSNLGLRPGTITSDNKVDYGQGAQGAAKLSLVSFDPESNDFTGSFYAPMGTIVTASDNSQSFGTLRGTVNPGYDEFTEEALVTGWEPNAMEVGEMHIFNLGAADEDFTIGAVQGTEYVLGDIYEKFEPAQMYYMAFCAPELTYEGKIEETTLPVAPFRKGDSVSVDQINWFAGHFTMAAPEDVANNLPEGLAYLTGYTADKLGYLADTLKPGIVFSAYYLRACQDSQILAGLLGNVGQFYGEQSIPYYNTDKKGVVTEKSSYSFGNKELGFNAMIYGDNGAIVEVKYDGDINYHYDSEDYRVSKKVSAKGNSDDSVLGVKTVAAVSDAETVATEYYNFQGIRVNAPEKGMYIVREYKADGTVVSKKVAK